jgi:hypothetical protein
MWFRIPPMKCMKASVSSPSPSTKALLPSWPTRLWWMWQELPMSSSDGFAMKLAEMSFRKAISLTPFL